MTLKNSASQLRQEILNLELKECGPMVDRDLASSNRSWPTT